MVYSSIDGTPSVCFFFMTAFHTMSLPRFPFFLNTFSRLGLSAEPQATPAGLQSHFIGVRGRTRFEREMAAMTIAPVGMGVRALGAPARANRGGASTARALGAAGEGMGQRAALRTVKHTGVRMARGNTMVTKAVTGPLETRLGSILTSLPQRIDLYFRVRRGRKLLWKAICAFAGFYTANVLSLTFGVLGINDVVAGAFCVAFSEIITRSYYKKIKPGKYWDFLNWFKLGLMYALTADAFKLGS